MTFSLLSAGLLGLYDIAKKTSSRGNAVPMVLLTSTLFGATIWTPLLLVQCFVSPFPISFLRVESIGWMEHFCLAAKSLLVGFSWTLAFFAIKHLPLSIAAPIRSSSPLWTILLAIVILGERPEPMQWIGIGVTLASFWALSIVGRREGIHFHRNRWVTLMLGATALGSISSIYDKVLLDRMQLSPATVQAWFTLYLVPVMLPLAVHWYVHRHQETSTPFVFRKSILWISPLLLVADMFYFIALSDPEALVSVVSTLRRCSVVVTLAITAQTLGETQIRQKSYCVVGLLVGVALVVLS